jgi:hypothetical protein
MASWHGGFFVASAVLKPVAESIADALGAYSAIRRICVVITTDSGGEMGWPNSDGRNQIGEQMDQHMPSASLDASLGRPPLFVFKHGPRMIRIPSAL